MARDVLKRSVVLWVNEPFDEFGGGVSSAAINAFSGASDGGGV